MVDSTPSDLDDLFGFGVPDSGSSTSSTPLDPALFPLAVALSDSRRVLREAATPAEFPTRAGRSKRESKRMAKAARSRRELSRASSDRRAVARASRDLDSNGPAARKLRRSEIALMHAAAPKGERKNPLSVLATMAVVGGLFAVAALPAYALSTPQPVADKAQLKTQAFEVSADASPLLAARDGYKATTPEQLAERSRDALRAGLNATYLASGARELGDDYPWPYELTSGQGGGLSPLNYYYRECVDFVAWRLNRDAGSYAAPYTWVWSTLTPTGGNASQWKYAWDNHGWKTSSTPIVGSVAWFGWSNHVAYVKAVNGDGTVLLEEYNYGYSHVYGQRTIEASAVASFLYPPG